MRDVLHGYLPVAWLATLMWCALLTACGPRAEQVAAANAIARAGNAVVTELVAAYDEQGAKAIDAAKTADEADAALQAVRERWRPVWLAFEALRQSHDRYADALENGERVDPMALLSAWCAFIREADAVGAADRVRRAVGELPICPEQAR